MLVSLTVGKVDAGVAVLLTEDKRLIEFPSILLPPSITSGSIVDIEVQQNFQAEQKAAAAFSSLQSQILNTYGLAAPSPPTLRLRNATQTSLVLEWDPLQLATSNLKSLSLYRNGSKAGTIPRPHEMLATKISGLAVDTEYSFHLILRTTGGTYSSPVLTCRTHKMTDLSGITVAPGFLPAQLKDSLETAVQRIGGKITDTVRIDTTHFVCTEPRGREWERAKEMNIPIVRPEWVEGCEREGRLVGVRGYYLDANPKDRVVGPNPNLQRQPSTTSTTTSQSHIQPQTIELPQRQHSTGSNLSPTSTPTTIQQLPTASVSSANLQLDPESQASVERRMGQPMSPPGASTEALARRASTLSAISADVPPGVEDGGPGPEVPPTPPPKDTTHEHADDDDEEDDEDEEHGDEDTETEHELENTRKDDVGASSVKAAEHDDEDEEGKDAEGEPEGMQDVEL